MAGNYTSRTRAFVVSAVSLALLIGVVAVRQWKRFAAQKHHESMLVVIDACEKHLHQSQGGWPSSWEDIEPFCKAIDNWDVRQSIAIDFDANPGMLAFEQASDFSGVQPTFQTNRSYKEELSDLIDVLRDYHPPERA